MTVVMRKGRREMTRKLYDNNCSTFIGSLMLRLYVRLLRRWCLLSSGNHLLPQNFLDNADVVRFTLDD